MKPNMAEIRNQIKKSKSYGATVMGLKIDDVSALCDEVERLQAYIDKTNYDSEQIATKSTQLEIEVERQSKEIERLEKIILDATH